MLKIFTCLAMEADSTGVRWHEWESSYLVGFSPPKKAARMTPVASKKPSYLTS